ncbi:RING finger protein 220 [Pteropus alecto]|uniref:RING finger protein 220 n=1 Tax=Pteropus alecto TaxID=9402 RepID=L5KPK8_PTEAL|nr:RING finger protein 220 [Pteropus alecto]
MEVSPKCCENIKQRSNSSRQLEQHCLGHLLSGSVKTTEGTDSSAPLCTNWTNLEACVRRKKKAAALFDSQAPICPICQVLLRPSELQEHMEQELEQLAQLPTSKNSLLKDAMAPGTPKSLLLSASIKREGESPTASPHSSATDDLHHSDRYQEEGACLEDFEFHVCRVGVQCLWKLQAMPRRQLKCWESPSNGSAERLGDGGERVATYSRIRDREFRCLHPRQPAVQLP